MSFSEGQSLNGEARDSLFGKKKCDDFVQGGVEGSGRVAPHTLEWLHLWGRQKKQGTWEEVASEFHTRR